MAKRTTTIVIDDALDQRINYIKKQTGIRTIVGVILYCVSFVYNHIRANERDFTLDNHESNI